MQIPIESPRASFIAMLCLGSASCVLLACEQEAQQPATAPAGAAGAVAPSPVVSRGMPPVEPPPMESAASSPPVPSDAPPMQPKAADPPAMNDQDRWDADCEYRQVFRAHGHELAGDTTKYELAPGAEYNASFFFRPAWGNADVQLLKSREIADNKQVVHHFMLYTLDRPQLKEGAIRGDPAQDFSDPNIGALYLLGGVLGASDLEMPDGVGLRLPVHRDPAFLLVVHYYNASDQTQFDSTGVEVCVTSKKRPQEAAAHWLGTLQIDLPPHAETDVVSTCRPTGMNGPAHIMAITPHMHRTGIHSKAVINRSAGGKSILLDEPYEFTEQRLYRMTQSDVLINPGDSLTMTCSYQNDSDSAITWGERTQDEMCFLTVWAWPAGNLHNDSLFGTVLGVSQDQSCLDP